MAHTSNSYNVFDEGRRRSSCCHFCQAESSPFNPFEENNLVRLTTPPLNSVYLDDMQPFSLIYILNLFIAPDMKRYLLEMPLSDDIYQLPVHLQKLVLEARMELIVALNNGAYQRLERVRNYVRSVAGPEDIAIMIETVNQLVYDEDELLMIVG